MKYPRISYVAIGPCYHLLRSFDGTSRGVVFESKEAAAAALKPGRAEMDAVAVTNGFLPRGATLVSRASPRDINEILLEAAGGAAGDPLDRIRLRFSLELQSRRSGWISLDEDAAARSRRPEDAARYESIVDELVRFHGGGDGS
jgi:hypothetical protein